MNERILLIEDDKVLQDSIAELLSINNFSVEAFTFPDKAIDRISETSFDLILCDNKLPNMTGMEVLKHLREQNPDRFIPFIMITAYDDKNTFRKAMLEGADDFINKPFKSNELISSIKKQLQKLKFWRNQLEALANFPNENPSPVTRISNSSKKYEFSNPSFIKLYESLSEKEVSYFNTFIHTELHKALDAQHNLSEKIEIKDYVYNVTFAPQLIKGYTNIYFSNITPIKIAEDEIKNQEKFYKEILDNLPADLAVLTRDMRYKYVNPKGIKNKETREWIIGKTDLEYLAYKKNVNSDSIEKRRNAFYKAKNELRNIKWEDEYKLVDGKTQYIERTFHPVLTSNGQLSMMIGYGTDITERHLAEQDTKRSRLKYKTLFDNNPQMVFIISRYGKILDVNKAGNSQLGYTYLNLINGSVLNVFPQEFHLTVTKTIELCFNESEKQHQWELIKIKKDGTRINVFEVASIIQLEENTEPVLLIVCTDITDKKKSELFLQETSDLNKMLMEELPIPVAVIKEGIFTSINNSFEQLFGYNSNEIKGKQLIEIVENSYCSLLAKKIEERYKSNIRVMECEVEIFTKNGGKVHVIISGSLFNNKNETYTLATFNNITEIRNAQFKEMKAENTSRTILNATLDAVILVNTSGEVVEWNKQAENIFGYSADEALSKTLEKLIIPERYAAQHKSGMIKYKEKGDGPAMNKILELSAKHKEGHEIQVELFIVAIEINEERMFGAFIRNIEERKKSENQLKEMANELTRQNEDLKRFAYITSHDLRAPVINLNSLIDYYDTENPGSEINANLFKRIEQSAKRISVTLNDLSELTKIKDRTKLLELTSCNLKEIFDDCVKDNEQQIEKNQTKIETKFDIEIIPFYKSILNSVFTNLITNSIKYYSPRRKLKIKVLVSENAKQYNIHFIDNGLGMDMSVIKNRLFSLYQRFHTHVEGKGLGLYLVKSQLEAVGASIEIKSEVNVGTEFIITIPKHVTIKHQS